MDHQPIRNSRHARSEQMDRTIETCVVVNGDSVEKCVYNV